MRQQTGDARDKQTTTMPDESMHAHHHLHLIIHGRRYVHRIVTGRKGLWLYRMPAVAFWSARLMPSCALRSSSAVESSISSFSSARASSAST